MTFVDQYYEASYPVKEYLKPNIIVCGNQWASGKILADNLKSRAGKYLFNIYTAGAAGFKQAKLRKEPEPLATRIKEAFKKSEQVEKQRD